MNELQRSILKTLIYANIFDYPLNLQQIHKFLISNKPIGLSFVKRGLHILIKNKLIIYDTKNSWFALKGRKHIFAIRKKREQYSIKKLSIAKSIAYKLKFLPYILFIGISGSLALKNADQDDDIDLFLIVEPDTLWTARMFSLLVLELLGVRRRPQDTCVKNKICVNMIVDICHLTLPVSEQDLYSAHEIIQLISLYDKKNIYSKFCLKNSWIKKYLANSLKTTLTKNLENEESRLYSDCVGQTLYKKKLLRIEEHLQGRILNRLAKKIQLLYMNNITSEIISDYYLRLHPQDARSWILTQYRKDQRLYLSF